MQSALQLSIEFRVSATPVEHVAVVLCSCDLTLSYISTACHDRLLRLHERTGHGETFSTPFSIYLTRQQCYVLVLTRVQLSRSVASTSVSLLRLKRRCASQTDDSNGALHASNLRERKLHACLSNAACIARVCIRAQSRTRNPQSSCVCRCT